MSSSDQVKMKEKLFASEHFKGSLKKLSFRKYAAVEKFKTLN